MRQSRSSYAERIEYHKMREDSRCRGMAGGGDDAQITESTHLDARIVRQ